MEDAAIIAYAVSAASGAAFILAAASAFRYIGRQAKRNREELYSAMDSVPEESRQYVADVLRVLGEQHRNETVGHRIRNVLDDYGLKD